MYYDIYVTLRRIYHTEAVIYSTLYHASPSLSLSLSLSLPPSLSLSLSLCVCVCVCVHQVG